MSLTTIRSPSLLKWLNVEYLRVNNQEDLEVSGGSKCWEQIFLHYWVSTGLAEAGVRSEETGLFIERTTNHNETISLSQHQGALWAPRKITRFHANLFWINLLELSNPKARVFCLKTLTSFESWFQRQILPQAETLQGLEHIYPTPTKSMLLDFQGTSSYQGVNSQTAQFKQDHIQTLIKQIMACMSTSYTGLIWRLLEKMQSKHLTCDMVNTK